MELALKMGALGTDNRPDPATVYDLLILGGGPAATTAAVYAARKMMNIALLTYDFEGQVGTTSEIENYMGYQTISGRELAEKFTEQALQFGFPIARGEKVAEVRKEGDIFKAVMEGGEVFQGRTVIVATGKRDRKLGVPGEDEFIGKGVAYCATCDGPFFRGLKVAIAGGGNSGFTAALDLAKVAREVTLINFAPGWQADAILQDAVRRFDNVRYLENTRILRIEGDKVVTGVRVQDRASGQEQLLPVDGIFVEIGLVPNSEPVAKIAALNEQKEVIIDCSCRTSVPGLFGAGDVTTVSQKQIIISAGEGAKAALSAYDYLVQRGLL